MSETSPSTFPFRKLVKSHHGVEIECVIGAISEQSGVQAVVNATASLADSLPPGEAIMVRGTHPPDPQVIYCQGPVRYDWDAASETLTKCYRNSLLLADRNGLESIAFPAIFIGRLGYQFIQASEIACRVILETAPTLKSIKRIRLVFTSQRSAKIACTLLNHHFDE